MSAARAYKDVIAAVTAGLDAQAGRNTERMEELRRALPELDRRLRAASDQHLLTRLGAELAWEDALAVLWAESWIVMRPFPRPDPWAGRAAPDGPEAPGSPSASTVEDVTVSQTGTSQIGTSQIGTSQIGTSQIGTPQIGTPQVGPPDARVLDVPLPDDRSFDPGRRDGRSLRVRAFDVEVEERAAALRAAVQRRAFGLPGR